MVQQPDHCLVHSLAMRIFPKATYEQLFYLLFTQLWQKINLCCDRLLSL